MNCLYKWLSNIKHNLKAVHSDNSNEYTIYHMTACDIIVSYAKRRQLRLPTSASLR
jgi:hypothetical protein